MLSVRWIASWPKTQLGRTPKQKKAFAHHRLPLANLLNLLSDFLPFSSSFPRHGCYGLFPCACFGEFAENRCFYRRLKVSVSPLPVFLFLGLGLLAGRCRWWSATCCPGLESKLPLCDDEIQPTASTLTGLFNTLFDMKASVLGLL